MIRPVKYVCPKCGGRICTTDEIRTTGSPFVKPFNFSHRRYTSVTCKECKYTEFYNIPLKRIGEVLDFFEST